MNKGIAIAFAVAAAFTWFSEPGWSGMFFDPVEMTAGEARIISSILMVGAAVLWFMPGKDS